MYLRDIVLSTRLAYEDAWASESKERQRRLLEFGRHTYCVVDLFVRTLGKRLATKATGKLIVNLDDTIGEPDEGSIREWSPYLDFRWPLDLTNFDGKKPAGRKRFVLDLLRDALIWIATAKAWDIESIRAAYAEVLANGICHHGFWKRGKSIVSPNKATKVRIYYECELDRLRIYCVFLQGANVEIGRRMVIDEPALDAPLMFYWKDIKWVSNSSLVLRTKDGRSLKCSMKDMGSDGGSRHGE